MRSFGLPIDIMFNPHSLEGLGSIRNARPWPTDNDQPPTGEDAGLLANGAEDEWTLGCKG